MLLPKAQTYPDFLVARQYDYVECKQGEESWSITDVTPNQEMVLDDQELNSWIFLFLGTGKNYRGKEAYLIPWITFKSIRDGLLQKGVKSVRYQASEKSRMPLAAELFGNWALVYVRGQGWTIPIYHVWWKGGRVE